MGTHWRNCVVTLIDLVGVRSHATTALASTQMRKLHCTVLDQVLTDRYSFAHTYAYNDAVPSCLMLMERPKKSYSWLSS
jgi:hypothetical protein